MHLQDVARKLGKLRLGGGVGSTQGHIKDTGQNQAHSCPVHPGSFLCQLGGGEAGRRTPLQAQRVNSLGKPPGGSHRRCWGGALGDAPHLSGSTDGPGHSGHRLCASPWGELPGWRGGGRGHRGVGARQVGTGPPGMGSPGLGHWSWCQGRPWTAQGPRGPAHRRCSSSAWVPGWWGQGLGCRRGPALLRATPRRWFCLLRGPACSEASVCMSRGPQLDSCASGFERLFLSSRLTPIKDGTGPASRLPLPDLPGQSLPLWGVGPASCSEAQDPDQEAVGWGHHGQSVLPRGEAGRRRRPLLLCVRHAGPCPPVLTRPDKCGGVPTGERSLEEGPGGEARDPWAGGGAGGLDRVVHLVPGPHPGLLRSLRLGPINHCSIVIRS